MAKAKPIPEGYHTITPGLTVKDCARALDFYKKAFGAEERMRADGPGGKVWHAEIKIGDSNVMVNDEFPEQGAVARSTIGGSPVGLCVYTEDVDAAYERAVGAGATTDMGPTTCSGATACARCATPSATSGRSLRTSRT